MKVSILIPAYNEATSIAATVRAALAQEYADFEVIVIDNASTDETAVRAQAAGAIVVREEKKGTMAACECGRRKATGEIMVRLDADCLPDPNWLARGVAYFKDPRVVGLTGPYDYFDASPFYRRIFLWIQQFYVVVNVFLRLFRSGGVMIGGNSFMRASTLEKMRGFDTSITFYGDDTDVAKRLSRYGRVVFAPTFIVPSSARRFLREGVAHVGWLYTLHFLRVTCGIGMKANKKVGSE